jgi:uncharacterized SAM-binding protein YcdF (DUF218 family)
MKRLSSFLRKRARYIALVVALSAGVVCLILSIPAVSDGLIDSLQVFPALSPAAIRDVSSGPPTAIVILSAGRRTYAPEFGGQTADEITLERVRYGAKLARETHLPVLVSGGAPQAERVPLAKLMADVLRTDYGIDAKWQESQSVNTAENAIYSAEILKQAGINRAILVTHAWHMKRAYAAFVANGLSVVAAPTAFYGRPAEPSLAYDIEPNMRALRDSGYALHEIIGSYWYAIRYGY